MGKTAKNTPTSGLVTLGTALDEAMQLGDIKVPKSTNASTMHLCGIRMDDIKPGPVTAPAYLDKERKQGILIVGPQLDQRSDIKSRFELTDAAIALRWVMAPAKNRGGVLTRPSIGPVHQTRLICHACDHREDIWWDSLFKKYNGQRKDYNVTNSQFNAYGTYVKGNRKSGAPPILCDRCARRNKEELMELKHISTTLLPAGLRRREVDPLCTGLDDELLADMEKAWNAPAPSQPDDTFLPRIWAVYRRGNAPTDFPPQDAKGIEIDRRLASQNKATTYTIRPARVAFADATKLPPPETFLIEANPTMVWGWVSTGDLLGRRDLGYKRRFMTEQTAEHGARSAGRTGLAV